MKRVFVTVVIAALLLVSFGAVALADDPDGQPQGVQGMDQFYFGADGQTYDNPGQLFQALREVKGLNPAQWAKATNTKAETVGEWLYLRALAAE